MIGPDTGLVMAIGLSLCCGIAIGAIAAAKLETPAPTEASDVLLALNSIAAAEVRYRNMMRLYSAGHASAITAMTALDDLTKAIAEARRIARAAVLQ